MLDKILFITKKVFNSNTFEETIGFVLIVYQFLYERVSSNMKHVGLYVFMTIVNIYSEKETFATIKAMELSYLILEVVEWCHMEEILDRTTRLNWPEASILVVYETICENCPLFLWRIDSMWQV